MDDNVAAPFQQYFRNTVPAGSFNMNHRKLVQYVTFGDTIDGDDTSHGTHVAGSIAGSPNSPSPHSSFDLEQFSGMWLC